MQAVRIWRDLGNETERGNLDAAGLQMGHGERSAEERSGTSRNAHGMQRSFLLNHPSSVVRVAAMEDVPGADGEDGAGVDDEEDLALRPPSRSHEGR